MKIDEKDREDTWWENFWEPLLYILIIPLLPCKLPNLVRDSDEGKAKDRSFKDEVDFMANILEEIYDDK